MMREPMFSKGCVPIGCLLLILAKNAVLKKESRHTPDTNPTQTRHKNNDTHTQCKHIVGTKSHERRPGFCSNIGVCMHLQTFSSRKKRPMQNPAIFTRTKHIARRFPDNASRHIPDTVPTQSRHKGSWHSTGTWNTQSVLEMPFLCASQPTSLLQSTDMFSHGETSVCVSLPLSVRFQQKLTCGPLSPWTHKLEGAETQTEGTHCCG